MTTVDYVSPRPRRRWAASEIISWGVILLAIGAILLTHFAIRRAPVVADSSRPSTTTLVSARYLTGVNQLMPVKVKLGHTIDSLEAKAKTPIDRFHLVILRGELEGAAVREKAFGELFESHENLAFGPETLMLKRYETGKLGLDSPEVQAFRERHGWFGDLALSLGKPTSDPLRASVLNAAARTVLAVAGFFMLAGIAALSGLVLCILAIAQIARGKLLSAFDNPFLPADRRAYVQGFAVYLVCMIGFGLLLRWLSHFMELGFSASVVLMPVAFAAGLFWPLVRGQSWQEWRHVVGLHTGGGVVKEMACGLVGYLAGMPLMVLGIVITVILSRVTETETTHPIVQEVTRGWPRVLTWFVLASAWAPISEELMFRGMLFGHLRERFGFVFSAVGVAVVFAIIHPQGWAGVPALGSIAIVLAAIREWRGSIIGPMTAHAINNTAVMLMLIVAVS